MPKIFRNSTDGFNSSPNKVGLQICIALKNPQSSTGYQQADLGSNVKHANHYTTDGTTAEVTTYTVALS
jgi:hypothetical protein